MRHDPVPALLDHATRQLEAEFAALPGFSSSSAGAPPGDQSAIARVLESTARRLGDNYPYFHPLYAGQMLKPPHPVARLAYMLSLYIIPTRFRSMSVLLRMLK